ncbi:hypothetical protein B296_00030449 [Ensete ventricosum]|uniref:Uncharacterized protein n=1 Tax=Ensete ventricosum TaxID=4639 RepID=A0A426XHM7_ENSVE|nr:hypothetical protein B296_00030449 [Ensete ventricosum]
MAALQPYGCGVVGARGMPSFEGLRLAPSIAPLASSFGAPMVGLKGRSFPGLVVKAATVVAPKVVYTKYAGTELEFNGSNHVLLKENDILGILETDDIKDLKPLNDRVLIKVIDVGPGPLDEGGNRKPLKISPGSTILYSKYAGSEFKGADGADYIVLRASDVIAVLPSN